ncbi:MAG: hypothetical protein ACK5VI_10790 [Opitutia bacterium]|jgi:hypothetical protein
MTIPHSLAVPNAARLITRPLVADNTAFVNAVPVEYVVPCAGAVNAWVRINTATNGGTLAIRLRRTNGTEYPVGFGPADTAVTAATPAEVAVSCKGAKEFVVRFTPGGNGTFTYLDVGI